MLETVLMVAIKLIKQLAFIISILTIGWIAIPFVTNKDIKGDIQLKAKILILVLNIVLALVIELIF